VYFLHLKGYSSKSPVQVFKAGPMEEVYESALS